ncbi:membrane protein [Actinoallomurus oryzae]|uniref:Membrane protein n=1 Tax=Actinoallomurus oryzae TaxID=502180 RepID=A0ABP8QIZ1_9ACTN
MTKILLIVHVLAAVLAVGPVAVAASMFPAAIRRASARPTQEPALEPALGSTATPGDDGPAMAGARLLHRVCRVYAVAGVAVPLFGFATAGAMHVTGDAWVIVSIALTALAAAVLALLVLPRQQALLAGPRPSTATERGPARLAMYTGLFNILWAAVTVLMIVRPGSSTGA